MTLRDGFGALRLLALLAAVFSGCVEEDPAPAADGPQQQGGDGDGDGSAAGDGDDAGDGDQAGEPTGFACTEDRECDDGLYCNGVERCDGDTCVRGEAVVCDDGIDCTVDRCSETLAACAFAAPDADGDGHPSAACLDADGEPLGDDCDDGDAARFPGNAEICDAVDHDEDCDPETFGAVDADGDDYLNANCCNVAADGTRYCGDDCDDAQPRTHPGNTEACDGIDNDCNGLLDHPLEDQDGDGWAAVRCGGNDCDDASAVTFPGADEICDGYDNDCSEDGGPVEDERDFDGDNHVVAACLPVDGGLQPHDCNERARVAYPEAQEACNSIDDDCDGLVDESISCETSIRQLNSRGFNTCVVRQNGEALCWGTNNDGQLGTGAYDDVELPGVVLDPSAASLRLQQVARVEVGPFVQCALLNDRRVKCWGALDGYGELGDGQYREGFGGPTLVSGLDGIVDLAVGDSFACALDEDGGVWCWGINGNGQLGRQAPDMSALPLRVEGLPEVVSIDTGYSHACAVTVDGVVYCWGHNGYGKLGDSTTDTRFEPVQVFGLRGAAEVACGTHQTCALMRDGTAQCWGRNAYGELGCARSEASLDRPCEVLAADGFPLRDITQLGTGGSSSGVGTTCALLASGRVTCFGFNGQGTMGIGEADSSPHDVARDYVSLEPPEDDPEGERIPLEALQITVGAQHACAIDSAGLVWCWGTDSAAQLAQPDSAEYAHPNPLQIEGL